MRIDLCWIGTAPPPAWHNGEVSAIGVATPAVLARSFALLANGDADATLFWDGAFGPPPIDEAWLRAQRADVVHAGLMLGLGGLPRSLDYIQPTWMWTTDPRSDVPATSWRLSLRACLVRRDVVRQLGGPSDGFDSVEMAGLELGLRYLMRGAFVRHDPGLVAGRAPIAEPTLVSFHDDVLFARLRFGDFWARWAIARGLLAGEYSLAGVAATRRSFAVPRPADATLQRAPRHVTAPQGARVSVVIPTIERYPYLRALLPQLAGQTYPVHEIMIVDQTPVADRDTGLSADFPALPLRVIYQDKAGQCTARNRALADLTGDYVLFLDDDVEIASDLVERHLRCLAEFDVDVSNGVIDEVGTGPPPEGFRFIRASDVFPTGNSMIRRSVLASSGMFDLAYDGKTCEDGDLGMRLYLAGTLMVLDPRITLLHHHAPRGGLRVHGARAVTYASSRQKVTHRNIPNASVVYLGMRYFTDRQVREMLALATWGTLRGKGSSVQRGLKAAYAVLALPRTMLDVRKAKHDAEQLLTEFPQIERLPD